MTRCLLVFVVLPGLLWGIPAYLRAAEPPPEAATPPRPDPVPAAAPSMSQDQLEVYFQNQKKGTPIQLFLDKGKNVKGVFSSFDDYYETVWILPPAQERGLMNQKGYKLAGIHGVASWDPKSTPAAGAAPTSNNDGFILMRKDAQAE